MQKKIVALLLVLALALPSLNTGVFASESEELFETEVVLKEDEDNQETIVTNHLQPTITLEADKHFTPFTTYEFRVVSDMSGMLSIFESESSVMLKDGVFVLADEEVIITAENMPNATSVDFIITLRPENHDFSDLDALAVTGFLVLTVYRDPDFAEEKTTAIKPSGNYFDGFIETNIGNAGGTGLSVDYNNGTVSINANATGTIDTNNNRGHFFYTEIDNINTDFRISGNIRIDALSTGTNPNQTVAGFMLTDSLANGSTTGTGGPGTVVSGYNLITPATSTVNPIIRRPDRGSVSRASTSDHFSWETGQTKYVEMVKIGHNFYVYIDGKFYSEFTASATHFAPVEPLYVGVFACRSIDVTFSNIEFEILDNLSKPSAITITPPNNTIFLQNTAPDLTGLEVLVETVGGYSYMAKGHEYVITGLSTAVIGNHTSTIRHRGLMFGFNYVVSTDFATKLEIAVPPLYTSYAVGEEFDKTGLTVVAHTASGVLRTLTPDEYTLNIPSMNTEGTKIVEVSFGSQTITFEIVVRNITVTSLTATPPRRTIYYVTDAAPTTRELMQGSLVTAHYSDGSRKVLSFGDYSILGYNPLTFLQNAGIASVTIEYVGASTTIDFEIKDVSPVELILVEYPKTTYFVGETLNVANHLVAALNNDGSISGELIYGTDYIFQPVGLNHDTANTYVINIFGKGSYLGINGSFNITVRDFEDYHAGFDRVVFGQSANVAQNTMIMDVNDFGTIGQGVSATLITVDERGKIADGHDGINFYYRPLKPTDNFKLSADVKIIRHGPPNQALGVHGQMAFGLMLRDSIGPHGDTSIYSSSIFFAGARGSSLNWQAFFRDNRAEYERGVTATNQVIPFIADGSPNLPQFTRNNPNNPANTGRITIERKNNNFSGEITVDGITRYFSFDNDIPLDFYDQDNIYVGFFTAREGEIEFSNATITVTDSASDPKGPVITAPATEARVNIWSSNEYSIDKYDLIFSSNIKGVANVYHNSALIAEDIEVLANTLVYVPHELNLSANAFIVEFFPDINEYALSYDKVIESILVTRLNGLDKIYISPNGNGDGTLNNPMSFEDAVKYLKPGGEIIMTAGEYSNGNQPFRIPLYNKGEKGAMKTLHAPTGGVTMTSNLVIDGDFWHVKGFEVKSANVRIGGNNNIIEMLNVHSSSNTGVQISRSNWASSALQFNVDTWPSNNLVLNVESYGHRDVADTDADGFAAKLTVGELNRFVGCVSHNNVDDGWDLYAKSVPIGKVIIDSSIAYHNGSVLNTNSAGADGNGFKLGGEGVAVMHYIRNSIAFHNKNAGFSSNSNPTLTAHNNVSFDNRGPNIRFTSYSNIDYRDYRVSEFYSYRTKNSPNSNDVIEFVNDSGQVVTNGLSQALDVYLYRNVSGEWASRNLIGRVVTDDFFVSVEAPIPFGSGNSQRHHYERDNTITNNVGEIKPNIVFGDFLKLTDFAKKHGYLPSATPVITSHPKSVSVKVFEPVTLSISAHTETGGTLVYSWYKTMVNNTFGEPIIGATGAHFSPPTDAPGTFYYYVVVTNLIEGVGVSTIFSAIATVTVISDNEVINPPINPPKPPINSEPEVVEDSYKEASEIATIVKNDLQNAFLIVNDESVTVTNKDLSSGQVKIEIPYTLKTLENPNTVVIARVDGDKFEIVKMSYYDKGAVNALVSQEGTYVAINNAKNFNDLKDHWASDFISFVSARELFMGISKNDFAPNQEMSRAMFVTVLARLADVKESTVTSNFIDVSQDTWYKDSINWAATEKIISGVSENEFAPNAPVTREQMAVILNNFINYSNINLNTNDTHENFVDFEAISPWARESVKNIQNTGIILGHENKEFAPKENATRADCATIFVNLIKSVLE